MTLGLFVSLAALGLAAIDPLGIGAVLVLLTRRRPLARSFTFLGGSFAALMVMGLLFARGLGTRVLGFENSHSWLAPSVEILAGLCLLGIAGTLSWQLKTGRLSVEPSGNMLQRLGLGGWRLFILGAVIVSIQSVIDVVFVIAMVRVGQLKLSATGLLAAVTTYAVAALVLQLAVVAAYRLAPRQRRDQTLAKAHQLLARYANQALIAVSFLLGCALLAIGA